MRIVRCTEKGYLGKLKALDRRSVPDPAVRETVEAIFAAVAKDGDRAVLHFTEKFGGPKLTTTKLRVGEPEIGNAVDGLPAKVRKAILAARANVLAFARASLRESWFMKNRQGAIVGERFDPFHRVGIYVPGGTAPLVSTAIMTCTLAQAAGVPQIVAVTPSAKDGGVDPALLAALRICGATEIYRVGGAQAIAALALGTKAIAPVAKLFGPGNAYVVEAKRQAVGLCAIDLLPGPSEVLVIADDSANAEWIAADLLAQSEHGHGSIAVLLTPSAALLDAVTVAVDRQTAQSARPGHLEEALKNALLVQVRDLDEAIALGNAFASEHVSVATREPGEVARELITSGAIFLGGISPVVGGDFLAGPSHELPTGGAGKSFAGLTADQFQRRTSIVRFDEESLRKSLPYLQTFSEIEGLDAHGRSTAIRLAGAGRKRRK
ncbi:MAG: histidinol dehydrogenase [Terrimicrobiaceae bacterium]|nr:histidinol dehydrogenase [Terrimicrobiaceae bacterium]